jgi:hypothetical protein
MMLGRPYSHEGVLITSPNILVKKIRKPGPLDSDAVKRLGDLLDGKLKPR